MVAVGGRDRQQRRQRRHQRLGRHPGVPKGNVSGHPREAAGAVARGGDRDAEEEAGWHAVSDEGGGWRHEGDRRHRELAGGRGGRLGDPEPGGGRDVGPEMAVGSPGAVRSEGRVRARRCRPVQAACHGLWRPEPGGGRDVGPEMAVGSPGAVRSEGRVRAQRCWPVQAARHGLWRPGGVRGRVFQGVQAPDKVLYEIKGYTSHPTYHFWRWTW